MAKKEFNVEQSISMVLKVTGGDVKTIETKKGSKVVSELKCVTPEGTFIKISNFERDSEGYVNNKQKEIRDIIDRVNKNKETIYIQKNIYRGKKGQFDWLTSDVSDDGSVWYKLDGFVDILDFYTEDEVDFVTYERFKTSVTKPFNEISNDINIVMYVDGKTEDKVYFTNNGEYEKLLVVHSSNTSKVEIGRAYAVKLKFVKGEKIRSNEVKEVDWSTDSEPSSKFTPDKLIAIGIKILDEVIESKKSDDFNEDFPF